MPRPSVSVVEGRRAPSGRGSAAPGAGALGPPPVDAAVAVTGAAGPPGAGGSGPADRGRAGQRPPVCGNARPGVRAAARRPVPSRGIVAAMSRVGCTGGTATVESWPPIELRRPRCRPRRRRPARHRRLHRSSGAGRGRGTPFDDEPFPCPVSPVPAVPPPCGDRPCGAAALSCSGERGSPVEARGELPAGACSISSRSSASPISDPLPAPHRRHRSAGVGGAGGPGEVFRSRWSAGATGRPRGSLFIATRRSPRAVVPCCRPAACTLAVAWSDPLRRRLPPAPGLVGRPVAPASGRGRSAAGVPSSGQWGVRPASAPPLRREPARPAAGPRRAAPVPGARPGRASVDRGRAASGPGSRPGRPPPARPGSPAPVPRRRPRRRPGGRPSRRRNRRRSAGAPRRSSSMRRYRATPCPLGRPAQVAVDSGQPVAQPCRAVVVAPLRGHRGAHRAQGRVQPARRLVQLAEHRPAGRLEFGDVAVGGVRAAGSRAARTASALPSTAATRATARRSPASWRLGRAALDEPVRRGHRLAARLVHPPGVDQRGDPLGGERRGEVVRLGAARTPATGVHACQAADRARPPPRPHDPPAGRGPPGAAAPRRPRARIPPRAMPAPPRPGRHRPCPARRRPRTAPAR